MNILQHPDFWNLIGLSLIALTLIPVGILLFRLARIGMLVFLHWWHRKFYEKEEREVMERADAWLGEIQTLPVETARARAMKLLSDPKRFAIDSNPDPTRTELKDFAPLLREVFSTYQTIETPCGSARLSLLDFGVVRRQGRRMPTEGSYYLIGSSEDTTYTIRHFDEVIYSEEYSGEVKPDSKTIFHLLIYLDGVFNEAESSSQST